MREEVEMLETQAEMLEHKVQLGEEVTGELRNDVEMLETELEMLEQEVEVGEEVTAELRNAVTVLVKKVTALFGWLRLGSAPGGA